MIKICVALFLIMGLLLNAAERPLELIKEAKEQELQKRSPSWNTKEERAKVLLREQTQSGIFAVPRYREDSISGSLLERSSLDDDKDDGEDVSLFVTNNSEEKQLTSSISSHENDTSKKMLTMLKKVNSKLLDLDNKKSNS